MRCERSKLVLESWLIEESKVVWTQGENGGVLAGEKNNKI